MSKQLELESRLTQALNPQFLVVENESHQHSSGRGTDSHFKLVIVSQDFENKSKVARHRQIYQLLEQDLQQGIHALALHLYTPTEWQNVNEQYPQSPNCLGSGK